MSGAFSIIPAFFNAVGGNISESEKARKQAEMEEAQRNQPGMMYGSAPALDRSNFNAASPSTVGANLIGDFGKVGGNQLFGAAIKGEADLYSPNLQATGAAAVGRNPGGFAIGSGKFDSDSSAFDTSAMKNYLNYLAYRR